MDGSFGSYSVLSGLPRQDKALRFLRRCAYIVGPIMRRRGYFVAELKELPADGSLLGCMESGPREVRFMDQLTRGTTVRSCAIMHLKVRDDETRNGFMYMAEVVQTMLHELAHMYHGSHGVRFYMRNVQLLVELEQDMEEDMMLAEGEVEWDEIPQHVAQPGEPRGLKRVLFGHLCGWE
jgi:hypothetical protein